MSFYDGDYVQFRDRDHSRYPDPACGHVCIDYNPGRDIFGDDGDILVRMDPDHGGWTGGDGHYYWWIHPSKLTLLKHTQRLQRPISPIFYEVRV